MQANTGLANDPCVAYTSVKIATTFLLAAT